MGSGEEACAYEGGVHQGEYEDAEEAQGAGGAEARMQTAAVASGDGQTATVAGASGARPSAATEEPEAKAQESAVTKEPDAKVLKHAVLLEEREMTIIQQERLREEAAEADYACTYDVPVPSFADFSKNWKGVRHETDTAFQPTTEATADGGLQVTHVPTEQPIVTINPDTSAGRELREAKALADAKAAIAQTGASGTRNGGDAVQSEVGAKLVSSEVFCRGGGQGRKRPRPPR